MFRETQEMATAVTFTVLNFVLEEKKTTEWECIAMKWRDHVFKKVNKICILSVLITDSWLLLKEKVAAAF